MTNNRGRITKQDRLNIKRARREFKVYGSVQEVKTLNAVKHQRIEVHYSEQNWDDNE